MTEARRHSILVNIAHEWFSQLVTGMEKRRYKLVHVTEMPKSITCVFVSLDYTFLYNIIEGCQDLEFLFLMPKLTPTQTQ